MHTLQNIIGRLDFWYPYIILIIVWDIAWRLVTMWKAGKNNDLAWFLCIAILNTFGILPIIYFLLRRKKAKEITQNA
jgi:hypothetical protein